MPRGIAPVAALPLIASAHPRFGTVPAAPAGVPAYVEPQGASTGRRVKRLALRREQLLLLQPRLIVGGPPDRAPASDLGCGVRFAYSPVSDWDLPQSIDRLLLKRT